MIITDVKIRKTFEEGPMKAIVSVTFDNELALHDIKVINAREKLFVVMPSRKNPDGTFRDIVHPINATARQKNPRQAQPQIPLHTDIYRIIAPKAQAFGAFCLSVSEFSAETVIVFYPVRYAIYREICRRITDDDGFDTRVYHLTLAHHA